MQKIRHSSRDPTQSPPQSAAEPPKPEPEIELIPEPATDKLPDAYFQPNFIADLRLNMRDDTPVSLSILKVDSNHAMTALRQELTRNRERKGDS